MRIKAIHQFHPSCGSGDGVSNGMAFTRRLLRELGFQSDIFCENIPDDLKGDFRHLSDLSQSQPDYLLLAHHSLGYENDGWLNDLAAPKVMVYHNITPEQLLPEQGPWRRLSALGRKQLVDWAPGYLGAIGVSEQNSIELRAAGYASVATISLLVDTDRVRRAPWNRADIEPLRDAVNILYVGRVCENKHQLELVDVLDELRHFADQPVRLIMAGGVTSPGYLQQIQDRIAALGLEAQVIVAGKVPDTTLMALYRAADVFLCMSEHEGFGMPLIESMLFDVPVVARAASGIPDTLGEGGLLFSDTAPRAVAALVAMLLKEPGLRRQVIAGQRRNLERFSSDHLLHGLAAYLTGLGIEVPRPPAPIKGGQAHPYWQMEGPFDSTYSLAIVNRELGRALARRDNDIGMRSMEGGGDFAPNAAFLSANPDCAALADRAANAGAAPDIALRFCYPPHVDDMPAQVRMMHSYGWEETGFPVDYAGAFNRKLDLITVLSQFVKKVLQDNGVRVPIAVTGGGVDHLAHIKPIAPTEKLRGFSFLHVSSCFPRKGVDALLIAYGKAFRDTDDVTLVIKTFPNPHNDVAAQLVRLRKADAGYPHVMLVDRDCSDQELVGWYRACDAFVAPSRGEGLGLPMAEAMLFGLPVITTGWGGQLDFCDDTTAWLCDYRFEKSRTHFGSTHSVWADPDVDHLAQLLREVRDLTPDARAQRTGAARTRIARDFTWDRVAERTEHAIEQLAAQPMLRREPRIGWISSWNKRCGIAAYSAFLSAAIPADRLTVYADRTDERTAHDDTNVARHWNMHHEEMLHDVFADIVARQIEVVVLQYNFGFFTVATLGRLIDRLQQAGIAVHCFFHATADLVRNGKTISLSAIVPSLARAARLYVHSVPDLNRFKDFGLVDNVVFFPQGVLPTPPDDQRVRNSLATIPADVKIVAAYGFLLPHKGLQQLIQAFAQLVRRDVKLHLLMVNALYPAHESQQEHQACVDLIKRLAIGQHVTLMTDFLPDAECAATLQAADLIVYPYQQTQESSSAAVRMGLASGKPVAVTPLSIFDDVADAVHLLPGTDPEALAAGIRTLLDDPQRLQEQAAKAVRWVASRQWPVLASRLLASIDGLANPMS